MRRRLFRSIAGAALLFAFAAPQALAGTSAGQPFPSNLYTTPDSSQLTGLRVDLPQPNCATNPSDCADVALLNQLDGFNVQPRISIPFSAPIDLSTVSSKNVFLVGPGDHVVGINQAVWEPLTNTLHVESDELLRQHSTYLLVVTTGIHGADGAPVAKTDFRSDNYGQTKSDEQKAYRKALLDALPSAMAGGANPSDIAAVSLFTTQSITPISEKIRAQIRASATPAVNFALAPGGVRTVFPATSVTSILLTRDHPSQFPTPTPTTTFLPTPALSIFPNSVSTIAFGTYASPDYETGARAIPPYGTATGVPAVQTTNQVQFTLFLPSSTKPAGGWPVVIFGHGFTDSKDGAPWVVASSFANRGFATIAINVVGHGFGPNGTYTVSRTGGLPPITFPSGGRAIDQDGNGTYDSTEGVSTVGGGPLQLIGNRDGLRQTVVDLMELVHVLEAGVDVDGVAGADLSTSRIYYAGQSFGGIYGVRLLGLEPDLRAGVPNVPGGSIIEVARLGAFRPLVGLALLGRTPSLYNATPNPPFFTSFNENEPLRSEPLPSGAVPVLVDNVPGASAIQEGLDRTEWAQNAGNPVEYAEHITAPVIIQFARGDKTVPNPTTTAILRAGSLADRATLYRNDLAFASDPAAFNNNPHTFLTDVSNTKRAAVALSAQAQMAAFFASDGGLTIDPDGPGPLFEVPTSMLPEDLAFIP